MENISLNKFLNTSAGQSTVEYILVMGILGMLGIGLFNSNIFKNFMGDNSPFFENFRKQMEYAYRHGSPHKGQEDQSTYTGFHDTYFNTEKNQSRFFISQEKYPNE